MESTLDRPETASINIPPPTKGALFPRGLGSHAVLVALFGAVGGALASIAARYSSGASSPEPLWAATLLGAGAAFIGVYLLTQQSTAPGDKTLPSARTLAMAVAFGIAWKPVMTAVESWASAEVTSRNEKITRDVAQELKSATKTLLSAAPAVEGARDRGERQQLEGLKAKLQRVEGKLDAIQ